MFTSGTYTQSDYDVEVEKTGDTVPLVVFGDVHYGAPLHAAKVFKEFCDKWRNHPTAIFLGMGDYMDFASTSERDRILARNGLHESTVAALDKLATQQESEFTKQISFMRGRTVGLLEGNHEWEHQDGTTTTKRLAKALGCPWLGVCTLSRLHFSLSTVKSCIDIFAHHGRGAASTLGGSLNAVERMATVATADIYLMGHDHKRLAGPRPNLRRNRKGNMEQARRIFGRTGSFLKAYEEGESSYVVDFMGAPSDLGALVINITPTRKGKTGKLELEMEAII